MRPELNSILLSCSEEFVDEEIIGRAFGIVPRSLVKEGYVDLEQDDSEMGTILDKLQVVALTSMHRATPPSQST